MWCKTQFFSCTLLTLLLLGVRQLNGQNYDYAIQQQQQQQQQQQLAQLELQRQQEQQQRQQLPFDLLQPERYGYRTRNDFSRQLYPTSFDGNFNNFASYNVQPPVTTVRSYQQADAVALERAQLQQQQQQRQQKQQNEQRQQPWTGQPIVVDYTHDQYPTTVANIPGDVNAPAAHQSYRNYNRIGTTQQPGFSAPITYYRGQQRPYANEDYYRQNQIGLSVPHDFPLQTSPNSLVPLQLRQYNTNADYASHFERYIRKYPERLLPMFNPNGFRNN